MEDIDGKFKNKIHQFDVLLENEVCFAMMVQVSLQFLSEDLSELRVRIFESVTEIKQQLIPNADGVS